jgi:hypothetical protein
MEHLLEVMFGPEHMLAEFFWNGVFIFVTYLITKARTLRNAHRYIDEKHGVVHDEGY